MRILLISHAAQYTSGGANRMALDTYQWLATAGHHTALAHFHGPADVAPHLTHFLPPESSKPGVRRKWLQEVVASFQPDVIQLHSFEHFDVFLPISRSIPVCVFLHDQTWFCSGGNRADRNFAACHKPHGLACMFWHYAAGCGGRSPVGNLRRWRLTHGLLQQLRHSPLRIQVASQFMVQGLLENGISPEKIDKIPLYGGCSRAHTIGSAGRVPNLADSLTLNGCILAPARLVRSKGIHVLLQAVALLGDLKWDLVIAGDGSERVALQEQARHLQIQDRVRFLGEIPPDALDGWYQQCQIVAFPVLRPEPFGLVGVEALAHGRPIVAFPGGAVSEWLWPGETGLLVENRTPEAFADALKQLLTQPDRCRQFSQNARKRHPFFHPDTYLARLLTSFEQAIRTRSDAEAPHATPVT